MAKGTKQAEGKDTGGARSCTLCLPASLAQLAYALDLHAGVESKSELKSQPPSLGVLLSHT